MQVPCTLSEQNIAEEICRDAASLYSEQIRHCYQLAVRWKRYIFSKRNVESDDLSRIGAIYKKEVENVTFQLSKLNLLNEEAKKYKNAQQLGIDGTSVIRLENILLFLKAKQRQMHISNSHSWIIEVIKMQLLDTRVKKTTVFRVAVIFGGPFLKFRLRTTHLPDFWYDKRC